MLTLSAAGLAAHGARAVIDPRLVIPLALAVLVGGIIGSHLSETRLKATTLKRMFAIIIIVAVVKAALGAAGVI